ncbi:MAG: hypothetical protein HYX38_24335 [Rhodospirillales bacterium]|nr:hypothetical protein [Rhodospirillales bacterium]
MYWMGKSDFQGRWSSLGRNPAYQADTTINFYRRAHDMTTKSSDKTATATWATSSGVPGRPPPGMAPGAMALTLMPSGASVRASSAAADAAGAARDQVAFALQKLRAHAKCFFPRVME